MTIKITINKSLRIALIVTLVATLLSFGKFNHCRSAGWGSPDVYIHMCYSDISALYGAREINTDKWPYASQDNSVEYPVLTGMVMWATGLLIDDPNGYRPYFDLNSSYHTSTFCLSFHSLALKTRVCSSLPNCTGSLWFTLY
jgi:hypothetical protein